ncbi:DUF6925 family protein [Xanthobacter autotrophicus]|uniref:DUF6925 family protein n=1 Tax=Xanthobacter autotrophicus TaxID=280 RepID=UPI0024A73FDC|nr:hypothetical protein [Xanthobacter autotrophicus]MDI4656438.1 hypothetical protein [Xanthobacter autotrophicus]
MIQDPFDALTRHALDPRTGWSLGIFGAIAEFMRDPGEAAAIETGADVLTVVTARGGLAVRRHPATVLVDYAMPSRHAERRVRARAACLPEGAAARAGRGVVTRIGPDTDALREEDRDALLFDLGLGLASVETCVRTRAPALIAALSAAEGTPAFVAPGLMAAMVEHSPHRVFASALGRIEVFQPIPPPGGVSPDGPHTHVLPKLIAHGRTHGASVPIPEGLVPCLSVHPTPEA